MSHYFPLLKGKLGEMQALERSHGDVRAAMTPIVQLITDGGEEDAAVSEEIRKLTARLARYGPDHPVIVDSNAAMGVTSGKHEAVAGLHSELRAQGVRAVPTISLDSTDSFVDAVRQIAAADGLGACLRVTPDQLENAESLPVSIQAKLAWLELGSEQVDLVLDMGEVTRNTVTAYAGLTVMTLASLPHIDDWRNLVLASGAFPVNLSGFTAFVPGATPRLDLQLWRRVIAHDGIRRPSFGDYGVANPNAPTSGPWRAAPNLRYATGDEWRVLKATLNGPRGHYGFHDICKQFSELEGSPLEHSGYSWGDTEIARCAQGDGGPGGGTQWRAWATSHHLAAVTNQLANPTDL